MSGEISPAPTAEEAVAIVAAVEALWPKPVVIDDAQNLTPLSIPASISFNFDGDQLSASRNHS